MTSEQLFVLVLVVIGFTAVAIIQVSKNRQRIKRVVLHRLDSRSAAGQGKPHEPERPVTESEPELMTAEESEAELERLQKLIEDRKQVAWNSDISYHLWGLYKNLLPHSSAHSLERYFQGGGWYDMKVLQVSTDSGLHKVEFELKGARYKFVDDEEKQGWREHVKFFSLYLYDDADRCLIEIPMKMKVDSSGRDYSILSGGPNAFLLGDWISDFINVKLKHQSLLNQEIRAQKHQERLSEIEDLKNRYGLLD
jgi:hypothetical protein